MPTKFGPEEGAIILRFGGGLNTRASEDEINEREAAGGENFQVDSQNSALRSRKPFDLVGTTPNTASIDGFVSLKKSDGTVSLLVQSGTAVYEWDGSSFGSSLATVAAGAKLRGRIESNWKLADKVIITDLGLAQPVMEWDGTTLQNVTFTDETLSTAFGTFRAKYCVVEDERAEFANIHDNGTDTPHLVVGSSRGDYTVITVANRPSSALSEGDPYFLVQPDYHPINGMTRAFGRLITSSDDGSIYELTGSSSKDFAMDELYADSGVSGDEALTFIGNDILYGRDGRIESLIASERLGDVEQNDVSLKIDDDIKSYTDWTIVYNKRTQRAICLADSQSNAWVLHKPLLGTDLSPWMKWTTQHSLGFQPTAAMNVYDPADDLEYIFMGDSSGNVYRLEGSGSSGDGGTTNIRTTRTSSLFTANLDAKAYQISGWIRYRSASDISAQLKILWAGESVFDSSISLDLSATSSRAVYSGGFYYNNDEYYSSSLEARLRRENFRIPSGSNEFQAQIEYNGTEDFDVQEIGLRFEASS